MRPVITVLGPESVLDSTGEEVGSAAWRTAKTHDLLRVLALTPDEPVATDTLLEMFWPEADPGHGHSSLRTAACQIRKVLGNESIERDGNGLTLHAWTDVAAYRALAVQVDLAARGGPAGRVVALVRQAEKLYRGDLEVAGTDCPALLDASRDLRATRARLLLEGAEAAARCADWRLSLTYAQEAADIELCDRATRALMRAWFAVGETARPVEEFERLRRHLADEYGVDPAPQTRALYLEVVSACAEWPVRPTPIGRDEEVRAVVETVKGWLLEPTGPTGVVWLVGPPGSGRQSVAREAARVATDPLADRLAEPDEGAPVEVLPDQGVLTRRLAATLRLRSSTLGRVMLVPVWEADEWFLGEADAVVHVGALSREDFGAVVRTVLQATPSRRLVDELYDESAGLPGVGCRAARHRLDTGELTWTPRGVDAVRKARLRTRVLPTLAAVPFALFGLFGAEGTGASASLSELEERRWVQHALRAA